MKIITTTLILFLAVSASCGFAQGRFMYGVNGGTNFWNLYRQDLGDGSTSATNRIINPFGGIEFGYFDWDHFSYSAQILFDQSSIEIPVLFNVPITHGEWKAYAFAGPTFSVLTAEYRDLLYNSGSSDYGIYGGLGISHALSKTTDLFMQAGYAFGLKNVFVTPTIDFPGTHYYLSLIHI